MSAPESVSTVNWLILELGETVPTRLDMTREFSPTRRESDEIALLLTASGPLLILTSHESLHDPKLLEELKHKGIGSSSPSSSSVARLGNATAGISSGRDGLHETDDLRVLDFNGQRVFQLFRFDELGAPILQEQP